VGRVRFRTRWKRSIFVFSAKDPLYVLGKGYITKEAECPGVHSA
jgi:hypothetical protein